MKHKTDVQGSIFDTVTKQIIAYEPGDVLAVSEIIADLEKLSDTLQTNKYGKLICTRLIEMSRQELSDSWGKFVSDFSLGLDLLRDAEESSGTLPEWKSKRIQEWISGNTDSTTSAAKPESVPSVKTVKTGFVPPAKDFSPEDFSQIDPEQLNLFISDCEERCSRAQELILELEEEPSNQDAVKELFRIFHTIKGECGFLKLSRLGYLSHNGETLLDLIRSEKLSVNQHIVDSLLKGLDIAHELVDDLKTGSFDEYLQVPVNEFINGFPLLSENSDAGPEAEKKPAAEQNSGSHCSTSAAEKQPELPDKINVVPSEEAQNEKTEKKVRTEAEDSFIKVKTGKVNYLVDMIGELLISLGQTRENSGDLTQIRKIARTLQYAGMQLRTESVHTLFGTIKRIIRDTANKVGRQIHTEFIGDDLEIDRTLIESLEEPLMHLVRNSIDHGIEPPDERLAAGKPVEGTVRIAAERRGNNIVISVGDDGRGLNREQILKKAVQKGLIRKEDIPDMSDTAVYNLIFISGFSTNETVSLISGRGVGMDIVKQAVTNAKGHILTQSIPGKGTTFSLFFPLSTAIIDGMTVQTGENIFIIPIVSIIESLKLDEKHVHRVAADVSVLELRGEMIPIISLAEVFGIHLQGNDTIVTIVENVTKERFAIASERILSKREVVIKNLGPCFKDLKGISSGTVLSGGTIGLVLDIDQVIELGKEMLIPEEISHEY
jgi:two-component system chemotaxis sensor kinase CheA